MMIEGCTEFMHVVCDLIGLLQQAEGNAASSRNLLIAVTDSDLDAVRVLLDPRQTNPVANVDTANSVGSTPLMLAVAADASDIVTEILDAGAAVDLQNVDGLTALHFAAQEGHESTLMKLLAVNPDLELRTTGGATPLYIACQQGHLQVLRILLQAGAVVDAEYSTGATPLLAAAQNGNVPIIKELLSANANLFHVNNNQVSAVHFAASSRAGSNAVKLVVSSGLSVDAKDKWMDTPLDYAAYFGNGNVVATLLELGANITALDIRQGLPLDSLCECKRGSDLPGKLGCSDGQCSDEAITRLKRLLDPAAQVCGVITTKTLSLLIVPLIFGINCISIGLLCCCVHFTLHCGRSGMVIQLVLCFLRMLTLTRYPLHHRGFMSKSVFAQDPDSQGVDSQAIGKESPDKPQNPPERLLETKPLKVGLGVHQ